MVGMTPVGAFLSTVSYARPPFITTRSNSLQASSPEDILKPSYEIEPLPIRIGHGFDIHRLAPIEEAGQPVVIGGVEIPHKDQKVGAELSCAKMGCV